MSLSPFAVGQNPFSRLNRLLGFMEVYPAGNNGTSFSEDSARLFQPSLKGDLFEKDDLYMLRLEVPGASKDDIKIHITDANLLKVAVDFKGGDKASVPESKRKHDVHTEENRVIWSDRHFGTVTFQQRIPANVDLDKIEVTYKNGMLYFKLPKKATSTPKPLKIH